MFILGLGSTLFVGLVWMHAKAFGILITKTCHRTIIVSIGFFHVLLWLRFYSPPNDTVFLWSCVIGYYTVSVVAEGQYKLVSLLVVPLSFGLFFQSILWALGRYPYLLQSEQLARPDNVYFAMYIILPLILTFFASFINWAGPLHNLVIDQNVQALTGYMSDIDYFAGPTVQYTSATALQHYSATTMYPLVVAVQNLNATQQKIEVEEQRRQRIEQFYASNPRPSWLLWAVDSNDRKTKAVVVPDVTTLLARAQKVTTDVGYVTRLSQARVTLMSDPQFSMQLQAYNLHRHTSALH